MKQHNDDNFNVVDGGFDKNDIPSKELFRDEVKVTLWGTSMGGELNTLVFKIMHFSSFPVFSSSISFSYLSSQT